MDKLHFIKTNILRDDLKLELMELWNREYPEKLAHKDLSAFTEYLEKLTGHEHILVNDISNNLIGWLFLFNRDGDRWFAMIIDNSIQGKGVGKQLLRLAREKEEILNAWVIDHTFDKKSNGEPYRSPLEFYLKNNFEVISGTRLELDKISAVKMRWERSLKTG